MKNWKTSLAGFIEAIAIGIIDVSISGSLTWKGVLIGAFKAMSGLLQKDYDTTGTGSGASKAKDISNVPIQSNPNR
jgi:hypothetical protein